MKKGKAGIASKNSCEPEKKSCVCTDLLRKSSRLFHVHFSIVTSNTKGRYFFGAQKIDFER